MLSNLIDGFKKRSTLLVRVGIIVTLVLIPLWFRLPNTKALGMGDFKVFYSAGFIIFWPMLWTIFWWVISGFSGIKQALKDGRHRIWIMMMLLFALWILLSWAWSYKRDTYPSVTISAALSFVLALLFAICVSCISLRTQTIFYTLIFGLVWNSLLSGLQVARQAPLGLGFLGEFQAYPAASGTAIVQADTIRWLRPYGLLPHPNMLGGFLVIGLFATLVWLTTAKHRYWLAGLVTFIGGLWSLFLTFSRGAWLGLAAGLLAFGILTVKHWRHNPQQLLRLLLAAGIASLAGGLFFLLYQPFLSARTGVTTESVELRSASDRAIYNQIAIDAIKQSPVLGVGIGNYPWYATDYLTKTPYDLRGQPVHNIFLAAWSELGLIGLGLFITIIGLTIRAGLLHLKKLPTSDPLTRYVYAGAIGGITAFLVIGLFDHYPWTLIQFQTLLWLLVAVVIRPPPTGGSLL